MTKLISWLLVVLVALATTLSAVLFTLDKTALNADYIQTQFKKVDGYQKFSAGFSQYVTEQTNRANPQLPQSQDISITVDAARLRVEAFFDQLQPYLRGERKTATLDFTDIIQRSRIAAFPIPLTRDTLRPVELSSPRDVQDKLRLVQTLKPISIVLTGLLALALLYVCYVRSRYRQLAGTIIIAGLLIAIVGLLFSTPLRDELQGAAPAMNIQALATIVDDIIVSSVDDIRTKLITSGAILMVAGFIGYLPLRVVGRYRKT